MTRKKLQFTAVALGSLRVLSTCQLEQSHRTSSNAIIIIVTIRSLKKKYNHCCTAFTQVGRTDIVLDLKML